MSNHVAEKTVEDAECCKLTITSTEEYTTGKHLIGVVTIPPGRSVRCQVCQVPFLHGETGHVWQRSDADKEIRCDECCEESFEPLLAVMEPR